jgi:hypothetical protein
MATHYTMEAERNVLATNLSRAVSRNNSDAGNVELF